MEHNFESHAHSPLTGKVMKPFITRNRVHSHCMALSITSPSQSCWWAQHHQAEAFARCSWCLEKGMGTASHTRVLRSLLQVIEIQEVWQCSWCHQWCPRVCFSERAQSHRQWRIHDTGERLSIFELNSQSNHTPGARRWWAGRVCSSPNHFVCFPFTEPRLCMNCVVFVLFLGAHTEWTARETLRGN